MGTLRVAEAIALFLQGQGGELVVGQGLSSATVIGLAADGPPGEALDRPVMPGLRTDPAAFLPVALQDGLVSDELDTQAWPPARRVGA